MIANIYNQEKVLGKTNWYDFTIQKIFANELYKGDFVNGKKIKNHTYYEIVVEPIVSKEKWNNCQSQIQRNARHYERTATYFLTNKLKCFNVVASPPRKQPQKNWQEILLLSMQKM